MATQYMHKPITVASDTPAFGDVSVTHNVPFVPGTARYDREALGSYNAVLIDATLADGTQVSLWPDGTIQVTGKLSPDRSTNFRIDADNDVIKDRFTYLETVGHEHASADALEAAMDAGEAYGHER